MSQEEEEEEEYVPGKAHLLTDKSPAQYVGIKSKWYFNPVHMALWTCRELKLDLNLHEKLCDLAFRIRPISKQPLSLVSQVLGHDNYTVNSHSFGLKYTFGDQVTTADLAFNQSALYRTFLGEWKRTFETPPILLVPEVQVQQSDEETEENFIIIEIKMNGVYLQ